MTRWVLFYSSGTKVADSRMRVINITGDIDSAKRLMLRHLKRVLIKRPSHNYIHAVLFPDSSNWQENLEDLMVRVKSYFANRRLLRIKNPDKVFVQGYGNLALAKLTGDEAYFRLANQKP